MKLHEILETKDTIDRVIANIKKKAKDGKISQDVADEALKGLKQKPDSGKGLRMRYKKKKQ